MRPAARVSRKSRTSSSRSAAPGSPIISRSPTRSSKSLTSRFYAPGGRQPVELSEQHSVAHVTPSRATTTALSHNSARMRTSRSWWVWHTCCRPLGGKPWCVCQLEPRQKGGPPMNPWKLTAIGMALIMTTALVTGLVVANWTGSSKDKVEDRALEDRKVAQSPAASPATRPQVQRQQVASAPRVVSSAPSQPSLQASVEACNQYAAQQSGNRDKKVDTVKDAGLGALVGAAVGAGGGAIADGGKGAGKGAAIGGLVGAGAGTLYGLNENKKHDERYREAYGACMRSRGYAS